ncbi:MAG: hypothetical protein WC819_04440 [Parcubacteria group bacterium]|jgi:hypothetical protein
MTTDELKTVAFHRENVLKRPNANDLLTMEDIDECKLPAMNTLLRQMACFYAELKAQNITLQIDKNDRYPYKNLYELQDMNFADWPDFRIRIKSNWFNPEWPLAIHAGFDFHLYVLHDGYAQKPGEIADWIDIRIKYLDTIPMSFASRREHIRSMGPFLKDERDTYFYGMPMEYTTSVYFGNMTGMSFKTDAFNLAVKDACIVMQKIIARKQYLRVMHEKSEEIIEAI